MLNSGGFSSPVALGGGLCLMSHKPMLEDSLDDFLVFYESDDMHLAFTFGADKRIYFIDFLDKASPIFTQCL